MNDSILIVLLLVPASGYLVGVFTTLIFADRWLRWMEKRDRARRR